MNREATHRYTESTYRNNKQWKQIHQLHRKNPFRILSSNRRSDTKIHNKLAWLRWKGYTNKCENKSENLKIFLQTKEKIFFSIFIRCVFINMLYIDGHVAQAHSQNVYLMNSLPYKLSERQRVGNTRSNNLDSRRVYLVSDIRQLNKAHWNTHKNFAEC